MKAKATISYEKHTPESVEAGVTAESGWWMPGNWHDALNDENGQNESVLENARAGEYDLSITDAINNAISLGAIHEIRIDNDSLSARSLDPVCDREHFEQDVNKFYTLHVRNCSQGTLNLIKNILEG